MESILIKNGDVITTSSTERKDVLVVDGVIKSIGNRLEPVDSNTRIIDASGCYLFPGGIDPHVHMELPIGGGQFSIDDFETGTRAAIAGGTTTIIDFVTPERGQPLPYAVYERKKAARKALCDYRLHMSVTLWNDRVPSEMKHLKETEGMTSVKIYMAYKESIGLDDRDIVNVMETAAALNLMVMVHCEHGETIDYLRRKFISEGKTGPLYHPLSRPPEVEGEAVKRAIMMAKATGCSLYIVHVSTLDALIEIAEAKARGLPVFAETCPHYLLLDEDEYRRPGFEGAAYVMSPPLRSKVHRDALWEALQSGLIDTIATDHCPFNMNGQKDRGSDDFTKIPNGTGGVQHRMTLLYRYGVLENKITLQRFVDLMAERAARIFGLYPQKGIIAEGSDSDIVLWDPNAGETISARTHLSRCDHSIYEGFKIKGVPSMTIQSNQKRLFTPLGERGGGYHVS